MGINQSNVMKFMKTDSDGKSYIVPVVLPPHKVHSSTSSLATMDSATSDNGRSSTPSPSPSLNSHGRFYMDDVDNTMFMNLLVDYDCGRILGKGSSAQVFEVIHKETGKKFACKVVHKNSAINDEGTMYMESEIMKRMRHDNVTGLHELYETETSKWFIMEMANGGSLHTALAGEARYTEDLIARNFAQVLQGVSYLHDMGIVHRDLKQDNILCTISETEDGEKEYVAKIADFGLSAVINTTRDSKNPSSLKKVRNLKEMWGTKEYFAPEVYKKAYGPQVDVWALGCVLYELLTGEIPFPVRETKESRMEALLLNGGKRSKRYFELRPGWQQLSAEAQDLIHRMLKVNPKKRYSIQECLQHPFVLRAPLGSAKHHGSGSSSGSGISQRVSAAVRPTGTSQDKILVEAHAIASKRAASKITRNKLLVAEAEQAMRIAAAVATTTPV